MPSNASKKSRTCPLCGKPRDETYRPFCSRGCRDRDLNKWFGEAYGVPVDQPLDGTAEDDHFDEG